MKKLIKALTLTLAFIILMGIFTACGEENSKIVGSGILISDFESAFEVKVQTRKNGNGYTFSATNGASGQISGEADEDKNISKVVMTYQDVSNEITDEYTLKETFSAIANNDVRSLPLDGISLIDYIFDMSKLCNTFMDINLNTSHIDLLLSGKAIKSDKWSITSSYNGYTLTYTVNYQP